MFGPVLHIICQPAKIQNHQNPASAASVATGNRNWDKDMPAALAAREVQVLATPRRDFSPKGDLVPSLVPSIVPSIVPCDSSSFLTHLSCWSRTKCLAATLPQLGLEISESVALQGSSRGHWGLIVVWPVRLANFCVWQSATCDPLLRSPQGSNSDDHMQIVHNRLWWKDEMNAKSGWYAQDSTVNKLEPLSSSHCLHDDSRQKPASVPCKPLVRLLSICPRFACRYYRRIRSHRLRQQGSCSAVSCTCSFEITFLQCWRLLLSDFYLQGTSANKQKVPTCRCRTYSNWR